jgi:hypothetical protein
VVSFTPRERAPGTHCIGGGWVDPRADLDNMEKWKFLTLPGLEPRPLSRPARSQSLYRLRYPGSPPDDGIFYNYHGVKFNSYTTISLYLKTKIRKLFFPNESSLTRSYTRNGIPKLRPKFRCSCDTVLFYKVTTVSWNTDETRNVSILLMKIIWVIVDLSVCVCQWSVKCCSEWCIKVVNKSIHQSIPRV